MNHYEMVCIVDVNWAEGDSNRAGETIKAEITQAGGEVENIQSLGRRPLAYSIRGHSEGLYLLAHFTSLPQAIITLPNSLKLNPAVIRSLIVRRPARPPIELEEQELKTEDYAPAPPAPPENMSKGPVSAEDQGNVGSVMEAEE